jgi:oligopeptide transport system permease protein
MVLVPYIARRLLGLLPVLLGISLITFGLMHALPGGPWDQAGATRRLSPGVIANFKAKYGLDRPLHEQYLTYMGNVLRGDLGISMLQQDRPIGDIVRGGLGPTLMLGLLATALALTAGLPLGVLAAFRQGRLLDRLVTLTATLGLAVPGFVLAMLLVLLLAVQLGWLAVSGWAEPAAGLGAFLRHATLPALCLAVAPAAILARMTRACVLEVLGQEHVAVARAKGLAEPAVIGRHVARNALLPVVTLAGPLAADLIAGSFIVESIFSIPGVGRLFVQAVAQRDYSLVLAMTLFYTAVVATANLLVDIAYGVLDPRIRAG